MSALVIKHVWPTDGRTFKRFRPDYSHLPYDFAYQESHYRESMLVEFDGLRPQVLAKEKVFQSIWSKDWTPHHKKFPRWFVLVEIDEYHVSVPKETRKQMLLRIILGQPKPVAAPAPRVQRYYSLSERQCAVFNGIVHDTPSEGV